MEIDLIKREPTASKSRPWPVKRTREPGNAQVTIDQADTYRDKLATETELRHQARKSWNGQPRPKS